MSATIVSFLYTDIKDIRIPGLIPSSYTIKGAPAHEDRSFGLTHIENAVHNFLPPLSRMAVKVPVIAEELADSLVTDFLSSCIERGEDANPGIFWLPGKLHYLQVKSDEFKEQFELRYAQHLGWCMNLVNAADADFAQTKSPRVASAIHRHAAKTLNMERDWNVSADARDITCPVCRSVIHQKAIVCAHCNAILKPEEYAKFQFVDRPAAALAKAKG